MKNHILQCVLAALCLSLSLSSCHKSALSDQSVALYQGYEYQELKQNNTTPALGISDFFEINLVYVPDNKEAYITDIQGERIFVLEETNNKVMLQGGQSFEVLDGNAGHENALFELPNRGAAYYEPGVVSVSSPAIDNPMEYVVDQNTEEEIYTLPFYFSIFSNNSEDKIDITSLVLSIDTYTEDMNRDGEINAEDTNTYALFSDVLEDKFWTYNDQGLKVMKVRFYYK